MSLSVLFYVQHLLGVGHLVRASLICEALVEHGAHVNLVTGGRPFPGFPGAGVNVIELPPVSAGPGGFGDLIDLDGKAIDDDFRNLRRRLLMESLQRCRPDILLIEAFPFGRGQMRFELLPLLDAACQQHRKPLIVCSLRDILQQRSDKKMQSTVELIGAYFDLVLVHGDPAFARLDETFKYADRISPKVAYTGVVSAPPGTLQGEVYDVVVSAGGGIAGEKLLRVAIAAKDNCRLSDARWCVLTGTNLDRQAADQVREVAGTGTEFFVHRPDFRALLANAVLSISQAGYNTTADILRAGCQSVMVPFATGGETEQSMRAGKLAQRGLVTVLDETRLNAESLAQSIDERLQLPAIGTSHGIDLEGANNAAEILLSAANLTSAR